MIIILKKSATKEDADRLMGIISEQGLEPLYMPGSERTVLGALGDERVLATLALDAYPFVDRVLPILSPYKRASRELQTHDTVVKVGPVSFGPGHLTVIAGPCAVENEAQIMESARVVKAAGAHMLRGGAYKPRTSPYSFQWNGPGGFSASTEDINGLAPGSYTLRFVDAGTGIYQTQYYSGVTSSPAATARGC